MRREDPDLFRKAGGDCGYCITAIHSHYLRPKGGEIGHASRERKKIDIGCDGDTRGQI